MQKDKPKDGNKGMRMLFNTWRQRWRDATTLKTLCFEAERQANAAGQALPGAEHFVLAALALPDGTARRVFGRLGADPNGYAAAISLQHQQALQNMGIQLPPAVTDDRAATPLPSGRGPYKTQPSAQALMQALTQQVMVPAQQADPAVPLLGAHVLLAANMAQHGVAARALRALGLDAAGLAQAASAEVAAARSPMA